MKKSSPRLKKTILEVVENQIRENDPPETQETLTRLINEGYSKKDAMRLIGNVVATEIFDVLKRDRLFDRKKFVAALRNLPKLPFEEGS